MALSAASSVERLARSREFLAVLSLAGTSSEVVVAAAAEDDDGAEGRGGWEAALGAAPFLPPPTAMAKSVAEAAAPRALAQTGPKQ